MLEGKVGWFLLRTVVVVIVLLVAVLSLSSSSYLWLFPVNCVGGRGFVGHVVVFVFGVGDNGSVRLVERARRAGEVGGEVGGGRSFS